MLDGFRSVKPTPGDASAQQQVKSEAIDPASEEAEFIELGSGQSAREHRVRL
jgi:hypothetical protein